MSRDLPEHADSSRLHPIDARYHREQEIGRGSIGIIYRAQDRLLSRTVAVKLMRPELRGQERQHTRFIREAQLCGRLGHPNIVPIYDVGLLDGGPALVMALLAGRSLRTIIRTTQVRMGRMLSWFTQVCNGLAFAHEQGHHPPRHQARPYLRGRLRAGGAHGLGPRQVDACGSTGRGPPVGLRRRRGHTHG
jgi:serine/threonine protein kinase